jgi:hypothetical protein
MHDEAIMLATPCTKLDELSQMCFVGVNISVYRFRDVVALYEKTFGTGMRDFKYRTRIDEGDDPMRPEFIDCNREAFKAGEYYGISRFMFH